MDLKIRFTFFFSLISLLLLSGFSGFVYFQVKEKMLTTAVLTLSEHLEHEAMHLPDRGKPGVPSAHPPHKADVFVRVWKNDKLIDNSFPPDFYPAHHRGMQQQLTTTLADEEYRLEGFLDLTDTDHYLSALKRVLILASVLCALAVIPLGYLLTRLLLSPFRALATAAGGLTAQQLSYRFSEPRTLDEFGSLKASFNNLLGRLEKSFSQVERFATQASHELRTPLAVLRSQIEVTLRRKRTVEEHEAILRKLKVQTERLEGITQRLLTLSDIERTQVQGTEAPLVVRAALDEICQAVKLSHPEKTPEIEIAPIPEALQWRVSPTYFSMLITNLLDNAIKHAQGKVKITVEKITNTLSLKIEDDGPGIPESERAHIFEPFYRIPSDDPSAPKGHGLGLAIVKACADACAGKISIENSSLGGAAFRISFPT